MTEENQPSGTILISLHYADICIDMPLVLMRNRQIMGQSMAQFEVFDDGWKTNLVDIKFEEGLYSVEQIYAASPNYAMALISKILSMDDINRNPTLVFEHGYSGWLTDELDAKCEEIWKKMGLIPKQSE